MVIDCRSNEYKYAAITDPEGVRKRVFVDGAEVQGVWYVDTEAGFVKTYHIDSAHPFPMNVNMLTPEQLEDWTKQGYELPADGAVSRTIYGKIELRPYL
jgi:hypothetical protein